MKKCLVNSHLVLFVIKNWEKILVTNSNKKDFGIIGDVSCIYGNVSNVRGNVSNISGNVSGISGDFLGIRGNVSGIRGNIDCCELSEEDRKKWVDISELIQ